MLSVKDLHVSAGDKTILNGISYDFKKGCVYAVMGPNGSGKSTLAHTIMGNPAYDLSPESKIILDGQEIQDQEAHERAASGIFLSFQTPLSLTGVKVHQLLQLALTGKEKPLDIRKKTQQFAQVLKIPDELLSRSLNEGASGGEKKKLEVLQAAVLDKPFLIFDEIDTGVDVDALKTIAQFLNTHKAGKTYIVITHYTRILHYLKPDVVLVLKNGQLEKTGDYSLAIDIEANGYKHS